VTARDVRLREVAEADLPILFENERDPEANRMAAFPPRDWEAFTAHWRKVLANQTNLARTVLVGGRVAGNVGSWDEGGVRHVGYWIGREFWGRGVATRALSALLDEDRARPVRAHVVKHNVGSIRVLEKCGFTLVGEDRAPVREPEEPVEEVVYELGSIVPSGDAS
jgi:RimJ/RimL family protein N-acetyltransferase